MDYFSKFLRPGSQTSPKLEVDHAAEFHKSWQLIKNTLLHPDERQLSRGIKSTDVPAHLQSLVDALVLESTRVEEGGTGACLEYLLKNDVLGTLVRLSETDRPFGIQAEVLRCVQNMVVLLDEQFLVHSAVHKAVLRLLRNCVGDDIQEQLDGKNRVVGAATTSTRSQPSEYEEDLVNLLCILCSRIRHYPELLMIFFHDKQWYRPEPLFSVEEEDEEEEEEEGEGDEEQEPETAKELDKEIVGDETTESGLVSAQPSGQADDLDISELSRTSNDLGATTTSSSTTKKAEYEFLLFNYLLRFVHREGQIGDFARAGLLFLLDVAMSPVESLSRVDDSLASSTSSSQSNSDPTSDAALALAEYILDGDFSDVLAAGLAAVYSVLPTKLEISPPDQTEVAQHSGMTLGSSTIELSENAKEKQELEREKHREMGIEESSSPDFKPRLDHFLKLLEFLQDVLRRNTTPDSPDGSLDPSALLGSAIAQSILDAVRRVFLENVLYPSVLECSDSDGSAVAVMSYVDITIRTLGPGQLGDLLVEFLTSEDNVEDLTRSRMRPHSTLDLSKNAPPVTRAIARSQRLRRRKSAAMVLLELEAPEAQRPSEYFTSMGRFTLKDLLLSSLRSKSPPTVIAALHLFHTMLHQYCRLSVDKLLITINDPHATVFPHSIASLSSPQHSSPSLVDDDDDEETFIYPGAEDTNANTSNLPSTSDQLYALPGTTFWTHEREMGLYLGLVSRVDPNHNEDSFSTGYEHYLRDAIISIENHPCWFDLTGMQDRIKYKHRLNSGDPILNAILEALRKFFANSPEQNMALTAVLATLASCPDRSLAGWLTFAPKETNPGAKPRDTDDFVTIMDDGDDRSVDWRIDQDLSTGSLFLPASTLDEQSQPVVYSVIHGLVTQLERYRLLVDNFDQFLRERRQGLLFSENLTDALSLALEFDSATTTPDIKPVTPPVPTTPKSKPKPKTSTSFVSFLTPRKSKPTKAQTSGPSTSRSDKGVEASPFGPHYRKTGTIVVEPFSAPLPSAGPWTPAKAKAQWNADEEDVFTSSGQWGDTSVIHEPETVYERELPQTAPTTISLSMLLDNVVILEESVKELAAIIHARRSLGIDSIRYL